MTKVCNQDSIYVNRIILIINSFYFPKQLKYFVTKISFHGEELLSPRPTPKLEDHPLSAVRNWGDPGVDGRIILRLSSGSGMWGYGLDSAGSG
jgi:hypothetical protein